MAVHCMQKFGTQLHRPGPETHQQLSLVRTTAVRCCCLMAAYLWEAVACVAAVLSTTSMQRSSPPTTSSTLMAHLLLGPLLLSVLDLLVRFCGSRSTQSVLVALGCCVIRYLEMVSLLHRSSTAHIHNMHSNSEHTESVLQVYLISILCGIHVVAESCSTLSHTFRWHLSITL